MRLPHILLAVAVLSVPVWSLSAMQAERPTATAPAVSPAPASENPDDRIRCRSIEVTGSLVRRERVCKTVGEWRRLSSRGNDAARDIISTGNICAGGQGCSGS